MLRRPIKPSDQYSSLPTHPCRNQDSLRFPSPHRKRILLMINRPPIRQPRLERRLDFPVLDQILDHFLQTPGGVVHAFACPKEKYPLACCSSASEATVMSLGLCSSYCIARVVRVGDHRQSHRVSLIEQSLVGATRPS